MQLMDDIARVRRWVTASERIVVLTGAGISTDSGIPDSRGPRGVWTRNPAAEAQSTIDHDLADPSVRQAAWRSRLDHAAWTARPNRGHRALVAFERRGVLHALITQNIDELHQMAGRSATCFRRSATTPTDAVRRARAPRPCVRGAADRGAAVPRPQRHGPSAILARPAANDRPAATE
jgi:hypothetical protein